MILLFVLVRFLLLDVYLISFFDQGTASIDFVDGSVIYLRQGDAKTEEQICLYRRISNGQFDFRDGNGDEREQTQRTFKLLNEGVIDSSAPIEDDGEASFESVFKQFSNSTLASAHMLSADDECDIRIDLSSSLLDESAAGILYQSPLQVTVIVDMIPAYIIMLISCLTRASMVQTGSLTSIASESDAAHLWQCQSLLNIRMIDDSSDVQADQS